MYNKYYWYIINNIIEIIMNQDSRIPDIFLIRKSLENTCYVPLPINRFKIMDPKKCTYVHVGTVSLSNNTTT